MRSEMEFHALRKNTLDNVESYLLDADGLDSVFFLFATVVYVGVRLLINLLAPGLLESGATANARKYTRQQYVVLFAQKGVVLPLCAIGWVCHLLPPELLYLLTGAYVLSDSIVNAVPVRGGSWGGKLGVHAHHAFTILFCLIGAHLPPEPVANGGICILVSELGSLWLTLTILHPTSLNIKIRFYSFVASRLVLLVMSLLITWELESRLNQALMIAVIAVLGLDNWWTLKAMTGVGGLVAGSLGRSDSLAVDLSKIK